MGDIHCLYKIKVNSGMIFLKRESLLKKTAEEASQGMLVNISGVKLSGKRTESCVEEKGYLRRTVKTKDRKAMHTQYWCCIVFF